VRWTVVAFNMEAGPGRRVVARFEVEARSIGDVLDSGAIRRNIGSKTYNSLAIYRSDGVPVVSRETERGSQGIATHH
jgi:hypothetical protein